MFIKLDGETIVDHDYYQHDDFQEEVNVRRLTDNNGEYIYKYVDGELVELSEQEILEHPANIERKIEIIRQKRNFKLQQSDWTQMPDSPLSEEDKQIWADYRQELRDLPSNIIDIDNFEWPSIPE